MQRLSAVWPGWAGAGEQDPWIQDVVLDSRQVQPGALFLAYPGAAHDGRDHIQEAVRRGAAAVVCEAGRAMDPVQVPLIATPHLRRQVGHVAARFWPAARRVQALGVTGTNGKTSMASWMQQALVRSGYAAGYMGTLGGWYQHHRVSWPVTTPDPLRIMRTLADWAQAGAQWVAMEASSHALDQDRLQGVRMPLGVCARVTHDHLDYHGTFAHYQRSKARLWACEGMQQCVVHATDPTCQMWWRHRPAHQTWWRYQAVWDPSGAVVDQGDTDTVVRVVHVEPHSLLLACCSPWGSGRVRVPVGGAFQAENLAAVISALGAWGLAWDTIVDALSQLQPVPGRMSHVSGEGVAPDVVIDYAHTPDALAHALRSARALKPRRVWCVLGCGGQRDRDKRAVMGRVAGEGADVVVITDDNPRWDDPAAIRADIRAGVGRKEVHDCGDRAQAIRWAMDGAQPGDLVLVAGKGHETSQHYGHRVCQHADLEVVRAVLQCKGVHI